MPTYRLSKLARLDLIEIGNYTLDQWGLEQALYYLDSLERCFGLVAASPGIGRKCDRLRKGYRRMEHDMHVVFYRTDEDGVLIVRILHQRVLPDNRVIEEPE